VVASRWLPAAELAWTSGDSVRQRKWWIRDRFSEKRWPTGLCSTGAGVARERRWAGDVLRKNLGSELGGTGMKKIRGGAPGRSLNGRVTGIDVAATSGAAWGSIQG
jgi:hypothetical protein